MIPTDQGCHNKSQNIRSFIRSGHRGKAKLSILATFLDRHFVQSNCLIRILLHTISIPVTIPQFCKRASFSIAGKFQYRFRVAAT